MIRQMKNSLNINFSRVAVAADDDYGDGEREN